jgi:hypothetical protein
MKAMFSTSLSFPFQQFLKQSLASTTTTVIPPGQAILSSLLTRVHRTLTFLQSDSDSIAETPLKDTYEDLLEIANDLEDLEDRGTGGYTLEDLAPFSDRLHTMDVARE